MSGQDIRAQISEIKRTGRISDFLSFWLSNELLPPVEQKTFDSYYKSYKNNFGAYIKKNYEEQSRELFQKLAEFDIPRVLEVGFGCGTESLWMALNGIDIKAIDVEPRFLAVAELRKKILEQIAGVKIRCEFKLVPLLDLNDNDKFNIVWMEQTFHHLEPREDVLDKLARIVKTGGYVVFSETNFWNPLNQILLFKRRGFRTVIDHAGVIWGNERILPAYVLQKSLKKRCFKTVNVRYFRLLPNAKIADKLTFLDAIVPNFIYPAFTHYNLVAKKIN